MAPTNPFVELGLPPDGSDPQGQLDWLERMVVTLESTREPRVKPIKKRVRKLVLDFHRNTKLGKAPEEIGEHFRRQVREIQIETFSILLRLAQQVHAGVQVRLARDGAGSARDPEAEALVEKIAEFTHKLRRLLNAMKKNDPSVEARLRAELAANRGEHSGEST